MKKQIITRIFLHKLRPALFLTFVFCFSCLLLVNYSSFQIRISKNTSDSDHCSGRYIYVHNIPTRFNDDLLKNCDHKLPKFARKFDLCSHMDNNGFGPRVENSSLRDFSSNSWYATNQFLLEVIFHNRMKNYECLTNNSLIASAIFVPYYAGIDLRRFLWGYKPRARDSNGIDLVNWLGATPEWKRNLGKDHFLVAGRISRDFRRESDKNPNWGSNFMLLPESNNMTMLSIEKSSIRNNDFAIPYPTHFHPSSDREVFEWQEKVRGSKRPYLFSFVGAVRSKSRNFIRGEVINQCLVSPNLCKMLHCDSLSRNCENPVNVMELFGKSIFCLQPPGDSFTRRSIFDSIVAGCIPVFFHPDSAYTQYLWHLPKKNTKYSMFISPKDLRLRKAQINETLIRVSKEHESAMREEIIKLIPQIIYADPKFKLESGDAFNLTIKRILKRIVRSRRTDGESKDARYGFAGMDKDKLTFSNDHSRS